MKISNQGFDMNPNLCSGLILIRSKVFKLWVTVRYCSLSEVLIVSIVIGHVVRQDQKTVDLSRLESIEKYDIS